MEQALLRLSIFLSNIITAEKILLYTGSILVSAAEKILLYTGSILVSEKTSISKKNNLQLESRGLASLFPK